MKPRFAILGGLAIAVLVLVGLGIRRSMHEREIQRIAARLVPCAADEIEVLASDSSDTAEVHRVRGCGVEVTVICNAPDFECGLASTESLR